MISFTNALQLLRTSLEDQKVPLFNDEDVPVISAAFCKTHYSLCQAGMFDRADLLSRLCDFKDEPKCWIRVQYNHDVIWNEATEIVLDDDFITACKAVELQEQKPWLSFENAINKLKE